MSKAIALFVLGVLVGGGAYALLGPGAGQSPDRATERAPGVVDQPTPREKELLAQVETLKAANEELKTRGVDLEAKVATLEEAAEREDSATAPVPPPEGAPTDEEVETALRKFLAAIPRLASGETPEAVLELRELARRGGPELIAKWGEQLADDSGDLQMRVAVAHALAQSGDPAAIGILKDTLNDPNVGFFLHRFASHALAFSPSEDVVPVLEVVARTNADSGARANAAFGLARRGNEEGIVLYLKECDGAIERNDPVAIGYLSGLSLIPDKALPQVRERLLRYKEPQTVLVLIEILKGRNDTGAVATLEKLAYDSTQSPEIQKSALGAIKALTPPPAEPATE